MTKNVDTSVTTPNFILTCSSRALYNYYNFQVADYRYSTATLATSHFDTNVLKCTLSCRLAVLQHIQCLHSAFDGNRASLQYQQHRLMSVLFLFPKQFRYRCIQGFAESLQRTAHTLDKSHILHNHNLSGCKL